MTPQNTPWWGFLLLGALVGFQFGFSGLALLHERREWGKQKAEWRRREQLEAENDAERVMLNEVFRSKRNQEFRAARRITLTDLAYMHAALLRSDGRRPGATDRNIGMEKRGGN